MSTVFLKHPTPGHQFGSSELVEGESRLHSPAPFAEEMTVPQSAHKI